MNTYFIVRHGLPNVIRNFIDQNPMIIQTPLDNTHGYLMDETIFANVFNPFCIENGYQIETRNSNYQNLLVISLYQDERHNTRQNPGFNPIPVTEPVAPRTRTRRNTDSAPTQNPEEVAPPRRVTNPLFNTMKNLYNNTLEFCARELNMRLEYVMDSVTPEDVRTEGNTLRVAYSYAKRADGAIPSLHPSLRGKFLPNTFSRQLIHEAFVTGEVFNIPGGGIDIFLCIRENPRSDEIDHMFRSIDREALEQFARQEKLRIDLLSKGKDKAFNQAKPTFLRAISQLTNNRERALLQDIERARYDMNNHYQQAIASNDPDKRAEMANQLSFLQNLKNIKQQHFAPQIEELFENEDIIDINVNHAEMTLTTRPLTAFDQNDQERSIGSYLITINMYGKQVVVRPNRHAIAHPLLSSDRYNNGNIDLTSIFPFLFEAFNEQSITQIIESCIVALTRIDFNDIRSKKLQECELV